MEEDIEAITTNGCPMMIKVGEIISAGYHLCYTNGIQFAILSVLYRKTNITEESRETWDFLADENYLGDEIW